MGERAGPHLGPHGPFKTRGGRFKKAWHGPNPPNPAAGALFLCAQRRGRGPPWLPLRLPGTQPNRGVCVPVLTAGRARGRAPCHSAVGGPLIGRSRPEPPANAPFPSTRTSLHAEGGHPWSIDKRPRRCLESSRAPPQGWGVKATCRRFGPWPRPPRAGQPPVKPAGKAQAVCSD